MWKKHPRLATSAPKDRPTLSSATPSTDHPLGVEESPKGLRDVVFGYIIEEGKLACGHTRFGGVVAQVALGVDGGCNLLADLVAPLIDPRIRLR